MVKVRRSLTLENASAIVDQALAEGRQENMMPLTVVVLDAGGQVVAVKSEDDSSIMRFNIALGKAYGALGMGSSSRTTRDRLSERPTFQNALAAASGGKFIPVPGGVLIVDSDDYAIGSVGISGDTSEKDEYCAVRAIHSIGLKSDPPEIDPNWQGSSLSDQK